MAVGSQQSSSVFRECGVVVRAVSSLRWIRVGFGLCPFSPMGLSVLSAHLFINGDSRVAEFGM